MGDTGTDSQNVGGVFAVNPAELTRGAEDLSGLAGRAAALSNRVQQALTGMAEAAGHPGLAAVLMETNLLNGRRLAELGVLYQHIEESLRSAASVYSSTDAEAAHGIGALRNRAL